MTEEQYEIKLPQFEGPFDLLLFFIERDELDIHNIPIAQITSDFLGYINTMQTLNIELASEFILVASTLMHIKAKMLLPRKQLDEEGNEIDPREELVQRLLEYKKYKSVIGQLQDMEQQRTLKEKRGNLIKELTKISDNNTPADELQSVDLYKLMIVFEKVMTRFDDEQNKKAHMIVQYPYTIESQKIKVTELIKGNIKLSFEEVLKTCKEKMEVIFTFLAILELLQLQFINIQIGIGYNNFWLTAGK
ncbi:MAG: segregation/condensation protein A [Bacteroidia bacterium]|nr:segregation/condensation protein A [Bacteroidia bacterium]